MTTVKEQTGYSKTVFILICALIVFAPLARGAVHEWAKTIIQICTLTGVFLLLLEATIKKQSIKVRSAFTVPIAALLTLVIISTIVSKRPDLAVEGLIMLITYIAFYFVVINTIRTRLEQRMIIYVIIFTAVTVAFVGLLKLFEINPFSCWDYKELYDSVSANSLTGTYGNRNHAAGFLEMTIPMVIGLFLTRRWQGSRAYALSIILLFLLAAQALTLSRGGWISTISSLIFMMIALFCQKSFKNKKILAYIAFGSLLMAGVVITTTPVVERITTLTQIDASDNLEGRIRAWKGTVKIIQANPFAGTGPGTFAETYPYYQIPGGLCLRLFAHNDYLQFLSETGILLILILFWALIALSKVNIGILRSHSSQIFYFCIAGSASIFALLIHSISDFNLNTPSNGMLFTICFSMLAILWDRTAISRLSNRT